MHDRASQSRRFPLLWRLIDVNLFTALAVGSTVLMLAIIWTAYPGMGRESDSFDYLSIAERFGPPLDRCLVGMDERGYDRREYLHNALDRPWGYPFVIATIARFSGDPATDCSRLLDNMWRLHVFLLIATCTLASLVVYRYWTTSSVPWTRAGFVYVCMMLDGYNVHSAGRLLTEVPSRFLFCVCLLSCLAFWASRSVVQRGFWIALGTAAGCFALLVRAEHSLVEPALVPAVVLLSWRARDFWRQAFTWFACAGLFFGAIMGVTYSKYGVIRPSTSTGLHLMAIIHRLPADGGIYNTELPPGVRFSEAERRFYEDYIIRAGKTRGGSLNPYMALPGIVEMSPIELNDFMTTYTWGILRNNLDLWEGMFARHYPPIVSRSNWLWPNPVTETFERFINTFGPRNGWWHWPLALAAWLLVRSLLARPSGLGIRQAPLLLAIVLGCFYWHSALIAVVGEGEERQSYFITGFLPMLGSLVVIDCGEAVVSLVVRLYTRVLHRPASEPARHIEAEAFE